MFDVAFRDLGNYLRITPDVVSRKTKINSVKTQYTAWVSNAVTANEIYHRAFIMSLGDAHADLKAMCGSFNLDFLKMTFQRAMKSNPLDLRRVIGPRSGLQLQAQGLSSIERTLSMKACGEIRDSYNKIINSLTNNETTEHSISLMGSNYLIKKSPDTMTIDIKPEAFGFTQESSHMKNILDSYNRLSNLTGRSELGYETLYANQISNNYSNEFTNRIDESDQSNIFGGARGKPRKRRNSANSTTQFKKACNNYCSTQQNILNKINRGNSAINSEVNMICNSLPKMIDPNSLKAFGLDISITNVAYLNDTDFEQFVNYPLFGGDERITDVINTLCEHNGITHNY